MEFAKQGAVSVVGLELVPEAVRVMNMNFADSICAVSTLHDAGCVQATSAQDHLYNSDLDQTQRERSKVTTGDSLCWPYLLQNPPCSEA